MALFNFSAVGANVFFFDSAIFTLVNFVNAGLGVLAMSLALKKNRGWHVTITLIYGILLLTAALLASKSFYESTAG